MLPLTYQTLKKTLSVTNSRYNQLFTVPIKVCIIERLLYLENWCLWLWQLCDHIIKYTKGISCRYFYVFLCNIDLIVKTKFHCRLHCRPWALKGWHEVPTLWWLMSAFFICWSDCRPQLHLSLTLDAENICDTEWVSVSLLGMTFLKSLCGTHDVHFTLWNKSLESISAALEILCTFY